MALMPHLRDGDAVQLRLDLQRSSERAQYGWRRRKGQTAIRGRVAVLQGRRRSRGNDVLAERLGLGLAVFHQVRELREPRQQRMFHRGVVEQLGVRERSDELLEFLAGYVAVEPILERSAQLLEGFAARQHFQNEELPCVQIVGRAVELVADDIGLLLALHYPECFEPPYEKRRQDNLL